MYREVIGIALPLMIMIIIIVIFMIIIITTVEPLGTDTSIIRTPLYYGQFPP